MLNLPKELGEVRILHHEHGTVELAVELPERGLGRLPDDPAARRPRFDVNPLHRYRRQWAIAADMPFSPTEARRLPDG